MTKKLMVFAISAIMLLGVFGLTACTADIDGRHNGFSSGFNFRGPRYSQIMYAVRSDKTEFNIDNVTLDFYCGWFGELPFSHTDEANGYTTIGVAFYITTREVGQWVDPQGDYKSIENQYFITEVSANEFWSESYSASQTKSNGKVFNHNGVSIIIPQEAFSQRNGTIVLYAQVISYHHDDELFHFDSSFSGSWYSVNINYSSTNNNKIKLKK